MRTPLASTFLLAAAVASWPLMPRAQEAGQRPLFRSGVQLVSLTAVVRDGRGKVVTSLTRDDFEVLDGGQPRPILNLRTEHLAPASVALLVDGSGSMRVSDSVDAVARVSNAVLGSLSPDKDDAALFSFDKRLLTIRNFTHDLRAVSHALSEVESWGSTSLYDAIASTAPMVANRTSNRRAIVVITDGVDTTSAQAPAQASALASAVDVPIYVVIWDRRDPDSLTPTEASRVQSLGDLAQQTGGELFVVRDQPAMTRAIATIVEELRHQYVLAFEAAPTDGWRAVQIRTRKSGLHVRSRAWYRAESAPAE
jgi:Ca-activated chloride channel homolog